MIILSNLSKNYGRKILFEDLSLSINRGEKIGLIGPNGAGKSTLFSLILEELEPSSGSVSILKNIRIGHLPQEASFRSEHTVLSELTEGDSLVIRLKKEKEALEEGGRADSKRYGDVLHQLEGLDYFKLEHKAKKILMGLGFKEKDFDRPITQLSGGWQMRALLGKLLTFEYDILLLDEPTNYLDLNAALWLKDYLRGFRGSFIIISHDKAFLNEVTKYTLILENGSIFKVKGNYEHYRQIRDERRRFLLKQFKEQEKKRKQLEDFVARFHAQPNKAAQVRSKKTQLKKMEEIILPLDPGESIRGFSFPSTQRSGWQVMTLQGVSKSYGDIQVYRDFDFQITSGEKAVLAGENGAGKSTLLKILAGVVDIDSGSKKAGYNVDVGYFSQTRLDVLSPDNTVLEEGYAAAPGYMSQESIRTILGAFLFTGDDAYKSVKVLSGGEKSRLILAKLLINPPNFLLLDEPTTHLDVDAVDALIKALSDYQGTIVFISHDIHFVRSIANNVFEVKEGRVRKFPGSFDYYLSKRDEPTAFLAAPKRKPKPTQKSKDEARQKRQQEAEHKRREKKKQRKAHNVDIGKKITLLKQKKDKLWLEHHGKSRALNSRRFYRDEATVAESKLMIKEIEEKIFKIEDQIKELNSKLI